MIKVSSKGNFNKIFKFLQRASTFDVTNLLDKYGRMGVQALRSATPVDTSKTSESWAYEIHGKKGDLEIVWTNTNINNGVPIAILIQYGHATRSGGFVQGIDFINPALRDVFEKYANEVWKEVTSL